MYLVECRQRKSLKYSIYHINNVFELKIKTKQNTVKSQTYEWQLVSNFDF